jgi:hypothetical protein
MNWRQVILGPKRLKEAVQHADEGYVSDPAWSSRSIIDNLYQLGALPSRIRRDNVSLDCNNQPRKETLAFANRLSL